MSSKKNMIRQTKYTPKIFKFLLIICDIINQKTILNKLWINKWSNGKENIFLVIIENKSDLYEAQFVTKEIVEEYVKSINVFWNKYYWSWMNWKYI